MAKRKKSLKKSQSKKNAHGALVIVESPAKCRTIEKILGKGFEVKASMGHVIDLPKSKMAVDPENNFEPKYIVLPAKRKILTGLRKAYEKRKELYLACDPDREGEAIAWHLGRELTKNSDQKAFRVRFNEITPNAIREAFENKSSIDMKLVSAQQARRVLDRIVGYSLSPLLWQKVAKGLSAGRVQSVALRIIIDREKQIRAFTAQEYWTLEADLHKQGSRQIFTAIFDKKQNKKIEIKTEAEARYLSDNIKPLPFSVKEVRHVQKRRNPQAPFTTSKIQQEAYNRLHFHPTKTMRIAQSLYEGVDLGSGETVGLITYMRTDSTNVSKTAIEEVRKFIDKQIGGSYLPPIPNTYKVKKSAQMAHEAIRPTSVYREPHQIQHLLTKEQVDLYELIWQKFVASQMKPALLEQGTIFINAGEYSFKATGSRVIFPGFLRVWASEEKDPKSSLPDVKQGDHLVLERMREEQHFTKPPPRFTDASLVKVLEEEGVGRPSTYAPIITTLVARTYVDRNGGALMPTELGFVVVELLVQYFPKLMDVKFTARMESDLDEIEEGDRIWTDVLKEFYDGFSKNLKIAQEAMRAVKKYEEKTDEICDLCQKPMVVKWGRRGRFMSCSTFPDCRFSKSIPTSFTCPQCQKGRLVARKARSGRGRKFYGCTEYPECNFIANKLPTPESAPKSATQNPTDQ